MESIKRDELYSFLCEKLGISAYVGIHGIATRGDIENKFTHLPKEEKAQNIMDIGLINAHGRNMTLVCEFFGVLPFLSQKDDIRYRNAISDLNNYRYINQSDNGQNENVNIVVAVPIEFQKSNNTQYFSGWINIHQMSRTGKTTQPFCCSDSIFTEKIPPEFIYGYYTYKNNSNYLNFHYNEKYYSQLPQKGKDYFIEKYIEHADVPGLQSLLKIASPEELEKENSMYKLVWDCHVFNNPFEQYQIYKKIKKIFNQPTTYKDPTDDDEIPF